MKQSLKVGGAIFAVIVVLIGAWFTDNFVYPFKAENPNFSDVERAFSKLQFPSDWQEINSSENRGLHGRGCDIWNDSGCFHKAKTFKVPERTTIEDIKKVLTEAGCPGVVTKDISHDGDTKSSTALSCGITNPTITLDSSLRGPESEVYVSASTQNF